MRDLMFGEFAKYQVLPLDASAATRFVAPWPSLAAGRTVFEYSGETVLNIPEGYMPSLLNKSYTITAEVEVPEGADGMIYSEGGRFFGYGLYLLKGKPVFTHNFLGLKRTKWEGPALPAGKHTVEFDFRYDGLGAGTLAYNNVSGIGRGGTGTSMPCRRVCRSPRGLCPRKQAFRVLPSPCLTRKINPKETLVIFAGSSSQ
jgi:hypothetical protein